MGVDRVLANGRCWLPSRPFFLRGHLVLLPRPFLLRGLVQCVVMVKWLTSVLELMDTDLLEYSLFCFLVNC